MKRHSFSPKRRHLLFAASAAAMFSSAPGIAQTGGAAIKLIVPFTPGTTPDVMARLLDPKLSQRTGKPVIVENKPGASGILGMDTVAKAPPDGQTLLIGTSTALTIPYFYKKVPFDVIQSFQPITMIGRTNFALVAHPSVPASNARELVAHLKKNPGKLTYGSPGKGTFHHLVMEQFAAQTETQIAHIPYKGSAGVFADLAGGHVNLAIMPLHVAAPQEAAGKLKIIGTTRAERDPSYPKIASLQEGGVPGFNNDAWYAVWGPKGMAKETVASYAAAIHEALASPEIKSKLEQQGITITPGKPEELTKTSQAEYEHWGKVIKAANIQPE